MLYDDTAIVQKVFYKTSERTLKLKNIFLGVYSFLVTFEI